MNFLVDNLNFSIKSAYVKYFSKNNFIPMGANFNSCGLNHNEHNLKKEKFANIEFAKKKISRGSRNTIINSF